MFNPWVGKIPWRWDWLSTLVFFLREFHGLYSPWGSKELDTAEQLSLHFTLCRQKWASQVALVVKNPPANARDTRDVGSIPGSGRSPGEGKGCPFQYSGLENFNDCIVHGVAKSWTQLSNFHFYFLARRSRGLSISVWPISS